MRIIRKPFPRARGKYREAGMGGAASGVQHYWRLCLAPPSASAVLRHLPRKRGRGFRL